MLERVFYSNIYINDFNKYEKEVKRIDKILSKIPKVKTVIEIGCGDGRLINSVKANKKIGLDFSLKALKHVNDIKILASVENIPLKENSIKLVICSEVLEHLNQRKYRNSLDEISRIASKYILISVPYKEDIKANRVYCNTCFNKFHPYLHQRSYKEETLKNIFKNFDLVNFFKVIYKKQMIFTNLIAKFKINTKNYTNIENICPYCGEKDFSNNVNIFGTFAYLIEKVLMKFSFLIRFVPRWIIAIYKIKT